MYVGLFWLLRFILNRHLGTVGAADLLMMLLLANGVQNAFVGQGKSLADALIVVLTVIFWNYTLDWLGFHFPAFQRLMRPPPISLVKNGRMDFRNMRKELISEDELRSLLRQQGIDDLADVKTAFMEGDGRISVVTHDKVNNPEGRQSGSFKAGLKAKD